MFMLLLLDSNDPSLAEDIALLAYAEGLAREMRILEHEMVRTLGAEKRRLVEQVIRDLVRLQVDPSLQEYTFKLAEGYMQRKPADVADRYPEIFGERERYLERLRPVTRTIRERLRKHGKPYI